MKNKQLVFTIAALIALMPVPVFSATLEELIGPTKAAELRTAGFISRTQLKNPSPGLLPQHAGLRRLIDETRTSLGPSLCAETLFLYEKPRPQADSDAVDTGANWSEAERAGLFNQVLALSTLTGIQYYSASRGAMRIFYESSRVIDNPDSKQVIPDPMYATPPVSLTLYARQKDLTFGDNIYRYDYHATSDAFFFVQENLTALIVGIIPAVGRNKLRTVLAVIDCGDSLLIYTLSLAKAASVPGMGERVGNAFTNRATAVLKWFTGRADGVFQ